MTENKYTIVSAQVECKKANDFSWRVEGNIAVIVKGEATVFCSLKCKNSPTSGARKDIATMQDGLG